MLRLLYPAMVTIHLLAALLWLGGMFFLGIVGAPVLRRLEPAELRTRLFHDLGMRFRTVGWIAIGILLASGAAILQLRGLLRWEILGSAPWWSTPLGRALAWKLLLVGVMISLSAWHDFIAGPRARSEAARRGDAAARSRRRTARLARLNALLGILLVYWAVRLARGG